MATKTPIKKATARAKKASGTPEGSKRPGLTKAQKAQNAIDRALRGLKPDQRARVLSNYAETPEPVVREVKVEEKNEHLDELRKRYASYRAGGEPLRGVESVLRRLFPETR